MCVYIFHFYKLILKDLKQLQLRNYNLIIKAAKFHKKD